MFKCASIPDTTKGGDLIVAGSAPGFHGQARVGTDDDGKDVVFLSVFRRRVKAGGRSQFVVGVQRRRMTLVTPFALEDLLALPGDGVEGIRVWRGLQGMSSIWRVRRVVHRCSDSLAPAGEVCL